MLLKNYFKFIFILTFSFGSLFTVTGEDIQNAINEIQDRIEKLEKDHKFISKANENIEDVINRIEEHEKDHKLAMEKLQKNQKLIGEAMENKRKAVEDNLKCIEASKSIPYKEISIGTGTAGLFAMIVYIIWKKLKSKEAEDSAKSSDQNVID